MQSTVVDIICNLLNLALKLISIFQLKTAKATFINQYFEYFSWMKIAIAFVEMTLIRKNNYEVL